MLAQRKAIEFKGEAILYTCIAYTIKHCYTMYSAHTLGDCAFFLFVFVVPFTLPPLTTPLCWSRYSIEAAATFCLPLSLSLSLSLPLLQPCPDLTHCVHPASEKGTFAVSPIMRYTYYAAIHTYTAMCNVTVYVHFLSLLDILCQLFKVQIRISTPFFFLVDYFLARSSLNQPIFFF